MRRLLLISTLVLALAACAPETAAPNLPPTEPPFPTMTPGRYLRGSLATPLGLALDGGSLANPATAVALANQPTATPDYSACPPLGSPTLDDTPPDTLTVLVNTLAQFLSSGGTPISLESRLRNSWNLLGENGLVRADLDLTGEGANDVIIALATPQDGGTLLIFGCANQRYVSRYQTTTGGTTPRIIQIGDMTADGRPEILFTSEVCTDDDRCQQQTQLITWRADLGRFVSLLGHSITSDGEPTIGDVDDDEIVEVVVRLDNPGDARTGPLRTGVNIYDWNGAGYVRSIVQLDPPQYRIQVVQQADEQLARLNAEEAISLYELALDDPGLQNWHANESPDLRAYILFRLLIARAFLAEPDLLTTYQQILDAFPNPETAPVYARLSTVFWNAFNITNNLRSACLEVREAINVMPESLQLLNRYGDRSPTYTAETVCPL